MEAVPEKPSPKKAAPVKEAPPAPEPAKEENGAKKGRGRPAKAVVPAKAPPAKKAAPKRGAPSGGKGKNNGSKVQDFIKLIISPHSQVVVVHQRLPRNKKAPTNLPKLIQTLKCSHSKEAAHHVDLKSLQN